MDAVSSFFKLPIPFEHKIYKESLSSKHQTNFIICSMFTSDPPKLSIYANRLIQSCEQFQLPYIIYEIPQVHQSISLKGTDHVAFTKANIIFSTLNRYPRLNVLYLDIDVLFTDYPSKIEEISNSQINFAIYNWLNDQHNEAYVPIIQTADFEERFSHFYVLSHFVSLYDPTQLNCSGAVQFYKNSDFAKYLLQAWQYVVAENPIYADDQLLNYTYNNFVFDKTNFSAFWLDKSYCRYAWWPHIKPVINHPDFPDNSSRAQITTIHHLPEVVLHEELLYNKKSADLLFPSEYVLDTKNNFIYKFDKGKIVDKKPFTQPLWIG